MELCVTKSQMDDKIMSHSNKICSLSMSNKLKIYHWTIVFKWFRFNVKEQWWSCLKVYSSDSVCWTFKFKGNRHSHSSLHLDVGLSFVFCNHNIIHYRITVPIYQRQVQYSESNLHRLSLRPVKRDLNILLGPSQSTKCSIDQKHISCQLFW